MNKDKQQASEKKIAITLDDLPLFDESVALSEVVAINQKMLFCLNQHQAPTTGFVIGSKLEIRSEKNARETILKFWLEQGHELGNHTYSHKSIDELGLEAFKDDVMLGKKAIAKVIRNANSELSYFRYPYLITGKNQNVKDQFEKFLDKNNYIIAPVTMVTSDWAFSKEYVNALNNHNEIEEKKIINNYIDFTLRKFQFNELIVEKMFGRPISHIWLLHVNKLHADCFDRLLTSIKEIGYQFITLKQALEDEVYKTPDTYDGGLGMGSLYRWDVSNFQIIDWETEPKLNI